MSDIQEINIDRKEFIERYLNTIIHYRKKYLQLDRAKAACSATELMRILDEQQAINIALLKLIYHPKAFMSIEDKKLIEEIGEC